MPNTVQVIEFKSQKDINKERQEKLDQRKAELRRRIDAIKSNHQPPKDKVYSKR
ncbi:hypothetical protein [Neobacillus notoginsengisoli]|uniref:hypothetical protein n=1 Tax=Neobacillus notoginsengisoli TaxID=1578198 RepID=UPI00131419F4|nr:hypothetical protein [Neobacillus notoginsengisoli]